MWMPLRSFRYNLGFRRNEQMECLKAFWGNTSDAKHQRNITIYIGFPWNVSGENRGRPGEVQKCPKNSQNWRHVFGLSRARAPKATGWLLGSWEVIGKESCGLERIYGHFYVHFETILGFTRNEQMGCSDGFRGNANGVKHTCNATSHVGTPWNVWGENMTMSGKV